LIIHEKFKPENKLYFRVYFLSSHRLKVEDMSLQEQVMGEIIIAMKAKDKVALDSLRAIKSALLLLQTETGSGIEISKEVEIQLLQKLVKQRKDSAAIFVAQSRNDLANPELEQIAIIEKFLPEQLTEEEIEKIVVETIEATGAEGMKDMGKLMGIVSKELAGKADGKTISMLVKKKLV